MADTDGLGGALEQAIAQAGIPAPAEEQLDLIAQEPLLGEIKRGDKTLTRGRPPGARNKRTQELADYILSRHRHPMEALAEIVDTPIPDLARALGCEKLEAAEYWRKCNELLSRYVLQAMPQAVKVEGATAGMLTVINLNAARPGEAPILSAHGLDMEVKENQQVSDGDPPVVSGASGLGQGESER